MHVCLILFPGFSLFAYVLTRETLRTANACAGQSLFSWHIRTVSGRPVAADDGTMVAGDCPDWQGAQGFDLVLLCSGRAPVQALPLGLRGFLMRADAAGATLGGLDSGSLILAKLGFLNGHEAVLPTVANTGDSFPRVVASSSAVAFDRQRLTTAAGMATAEGLLAWIARTHSPALAAQTADSLGHGRLHTASACQRLPVEADPLLQKMQAIMAARIEDPLPIERIAAELDLSPKQLRLRCRKGLNRTPAEVYLGLRLDRAAQLVAETELSVLDIARAAGFASPSAFTRSYHARFGAPPRRQRRMNESSGGSMAKGSTKSKNVPVTH